MTEAEYRQLFADQGPKMPPERDLVKTADLANGYTLYVQDNGAGGQTYWSDEIPGGVMVWDTSLVPQETLITALASEHRRTPDPNYPPIASVEFVCTGCGRNVYSLSNPMTTANRCAVCQWVDEFSNPAEREALRKMLTDDFHALAPDGKSYIDRRFPERECDFCHKPYHGPAVYCSLECAHADA